jgi:uracil-DNA glycosylase family 4
MDLLPIFTEALYDPKKQEMLEKLYPAFPFDGPGMPQPGVDFIQTAIALGDEIAAADIKKKKVPVSKYLDYLYRRALYDEKFAIKIVGKRGPFDAQLIPGHLIGNFAVDHEGRASHAHGITYKPAPAKIMVIGKIPGNDNLAQKNGIAGAGMAEFFRALHSAGVHPNEYAKWYVTFACKFSTPNANFDTIQASWIKDCAPLLAQELRMVRPDYILCLGNDATKAVMNSTAKLSGRVGTIKVQISDTEEHEIKVMSCLHPAYVAIRPEAYDDFAAQVARFVALIENKLVTSEVVDHAEIYTEEGLTGLVDAMLQDPDPNANIIAVDCEWHGDYPTEPGAYLRTVQISNKDKWARTIVLRYEGGAEAFRPSLDAAKTQLRRLLKSTDSRCVRVGGHFLRADLPWLIDFGVDVRDEYAPATTADDRQKGGWDTSLMYHAVNETAKYGLDECSMRFTGAPMYWARLDKWKKSYCTQNKLKSEELGGYGECPSHILHPYANYDADVTRRIMIHFYGTNGYDGAMAKDMHGNDCWLPYWTAHQASLAFLEMEMTGLVIDRARADELTNIFMQKQEELLEEVRAELNWPNFNPKSHPQLAVALFGKSFKANFTNAVTIPDDAELLDLTPIKTTGKRPKLWNELNNEDKAKIPPSTDKESLGIIGHLNPTAAKIRDYKFIAQVLQSVLRKPNTTSDGDFEVDDNGNYSYEKGLVGCVHADGKVRTHLFQTKETGRASSSRPPLQNLSSRREDDYKRILGKTKYTHPVRSVLCVPEGCVGIETDLTGAELAVLAWLSQDANMIEHVRRNLLPENNPDHYDIHSQQAVKTFALRDVVPTKAGMVAAGKKGLRVAAKNVNFGIPYGRGGEAIARQCKEEGVDVTAEDCQRMIDAYFDSYPGTRGFLNECQTRSQDPGWIVGPYGRYRRFIPPAKFDRKVVGEQQRQAQNFPIQGGVADAVSIALNNFLIYRQENLDVDYKIALQIHDAIVLIVPIEHAEHVYKEVIPACMIDRLPFWPRRLDGTSIPTREPYHFGMSRDVFTHWGENLSEKDAAKLGLKWLEEILAEEHA